MSKVFKFLFFYFLICIVMGCSFYNNEFGQIGLTFPECQVQQKNENSRSGINGKDEKPIDYNIKIAKIDSGTVLIGEKTAKAGDKILINSLKPGNYRIFVTGESEHLIWEGSSDVTVIAGKTVKTTVNLKCREGNFKVKAVAPSNNSDIMYFDTVNEAVQWGGSLPYNPDIRITVKDKVIESEEIIISSNNYFTIEGYNSNAVISGNNKHRVMTVGSIGASPNVSLRNITITEGFSSDNGGGIKLLTGRLNLEDGARITGNKLDSSKNLKGSGIYVAGNDKNTKLHIEGDAKVVEDNNIFLDGTLSIDILSKITCDGYCAEIDCDPVLIVDDSNRPRLRQLVYSIPLFNGMTNYFPENIKKFKIPQEIKDKEWFLDGQGLLNRRLDADTVLKMGAINYPKDFRFLVTTNDNVILPAFLEANGQTKPDVRYDVEVAEGITDIKTAFYQNSNLEKVKLPVSVTTLPKNAFLNSKKLTTVIFADKDSSWTLKRDQTLVDSDYRVAEKTQEDIISHLIDGTEWTKNVVP